MSIPMVDLNAEYALLEPELLPAVKTALASGQYVQGPNVRAFEQEVARYLGVRHAIGVASGTDALMLALRAAGVGPGDEVITTPFSFIATASAIAMTGAKPVFVDIDPLTFNLDPANVEAAITPRTRAVLPVHLYGQAVDLEPLLAICACHGLRLIEDCAQAMGADYKGRKVGAWGHAGCLSFDPSQTLGAFGDGGMVVTDDDALAARVRMLANHGSVIRDHHEAPPFCASSCCIWTSSIVGAAKTPGAIARRSRAWLSNCRSKRAWARTFTTTSRSRATSASGSAPRSPGRASQAPFTTRFRCTVSRFGTTPTPTCICRTRNGRRSACCRCRCRRCSSPSRSMRSPTRSPRRSGCGAGQAHRACRERRFVRTKNRSVRRAADRPSARRGVRSDRAQRVSP
jgi:hypothetical protein